MKGDFEVNSRVRTRDTKNGMVIKVADDEALLVKFFDGTRDAWFSEDQLKYLGTPGFDCPYESDYDRYNLEDFR